MRNLIPILLFPAILVFTSCSPTRKLKSGTYLLDKVDVLNTRETGIAKEEFEKFYRQRPNRKFLRNIHFYVWWWNLFDDNKMAARRVRRNQRYDRINAERVKKNDRRNEERMRKGKKPKSPKLKDKERPLLIENIRDIGERPVLHDTTLTEQTRTQLNRYLFVKGFFNGEVKYQVQLTHHNKRAVVRYELIPGQPYIVKSISYQMDDPALGELFLRDTVHSLLSRGMRYDEEKFRDERQRLSDLAQNSGYYYFENAYISFDADSSLGDHGVSLKRRLKKFTKPAGDSDDSVVYVNHARLTLDQVYVITEPVIGNVRDVYFKDTLREPSGQLMFLLNKPLPFRQSVLRNNIDLYKGQLFRKDTAEQTYRQLIGTNMFRNVLVQFLPSRLRSDRLDCYIICTPLIRQSLSGETVGTNTSGNRGIDASVIYQNRNSFRGGELVELRMMGSISAQAQLNTEETAEKVFNTIQFGPELTFAVPRAFFPFSLLPFRRDQSPHTYVKTGINYQARPIYDRVITSVDYGFNFRTHKNTLRHDLIPVEIYMVRAHLADTFKNTLERSNDAFLINSFQDHITTLTKYSVSYLSAEDANTSRRTVNYLRWTISSSGSLLRKFFDMTGRKKDSLGRYLILGIPFAQFIKTDIDYRIYVPIRKKSRIVYRIAGGIGIPLVNLGVIPYEQSFFSGGPNSVRAWRARTLGPGGYDPSGSNARFDKIGDILLEGNIEYRFNLIGNFNGALFADAGNIWRLKPDESKPGAEFYVDRFLDQIAIGGGIGIRWDLNFFVLRFDLAAPLKDPRYAPDDRWTFNKRPLKDLVLNFGIGYPF
jgi:outer membrane protein assembly factor BamA